MEPGLSVLGVVRVALLPNHLLDHLHSSPTGGGEKKALAAQVRKRPAATIFMMVAAVNILVTPLPEPIAPGRRGKGKLGSQQLDPIRL